MGDVFVLAEHRQGALRDITWEMLNLASQIAPDAKGGEVVAVLLGHGPDNFASQLAGGHVTGFSVSMTPCWLILTAISIRKFLRP